MKTKDASQVGKQELNRYLLSDKSMARLVRETVMIDQGLLSR